MSRMFQKARRFFSYAIITTIFFALICFVPFGEVLASETLKEPEIVVSGNEVTYQWSIDENGHLLITGESIDLSEKKNGPEWCRYYSSEIKTATVDLSGKSTNLSHMFSSCTSLESVQFVNFDTSCVTDMSYMFQACLELKEVDVTGFDTRNVTNMSCMFYVCQSLKELDLSSFRTPKLKYAYAMFSAMGDELELLDLSQFDFSNIVDFNDFGSLLGGTSPKVIKLPNIPREIYLCSVSDVDYIDDEGNILYFSRKNAGRTVTYWNMKYYRFSTCAIKGHAYAKPRFTWNTFPDVYLVVECNRENCPEIKDACIQIPAKITKEVTLPTTEKEGVITYTASAVWNENTYTDSLNIKLAKLEATEEETVKEEQEPVPETSEIKVGTIFSYQGAKYKVTRNNGLQKEVQYVKPLSKNIKTVKVPKQVKYLESTFKVTSIADNAWKNNKKLKKLVIGSDVIKIGKNVCYGCKNLKQIQIKSKKLKKIGKNAFKGIYKKAKFDVPNSKVKAYKKLFTTKTGFQKTMYLR